MIVATPLTLEEEIEKQQQSLIILQKKLKLKDVEELIRTEQTKVQALQKQLDFATRSIQEQQTTATHLRTEITTQEQGWKNRWNVKDDKLETIQAQAKEIETLKEAKVKIEKDAEAEKGRVLREQMMSSERRMEEKVKEELEKVKHCLQAGIYVRNRKLEWGRSKALQNEKIIVCGNAVSHYGMALADATLYQGVFGVKRTDTQTYEALYGVSPDRAWKMQECHEFIRVLDWHGSNKDFYKRSDESVTVFKNLLTSLASVPDAEKMNERFRDPAIATLYKEAMIIYEKAYDVHKQVLLSR